MGGGAGGAGRTRRAFAAALSLAAALAAAGCGGGLYVGFGDDEYPAVSVAASVASAAPGQSLRLVAAASDDDFVAEVRFYRLDPDGRATFLGSDGSPPWDLDTAVPSNAVRGSTLYYQARAIDSAGQASDSDTVPVRVD